MTDKTRWYVAGLAIIVGAVLVIAGGLSGDQWVSVVGGIFAGGGALTGPGAPPK